MIINLLVAASENNVIGKDNKLLWHLPNDMVYFKNLTWALPVIMGRKTFDALGKPLRGRTNIIISRNSKANIQGTVHAANLGEAVRIADETDAKECFVIGGGQIFEQSMSLADRIYMTRIEANFDGDTFFPVIDSSQWRRVSIRPFEKDDRHAYAYRFEVWEKNKTNH